MELSAVSLEAEIETEIEIDKSVDEVLVDPELELTANSSSSLIVGEGQISAGARGIFSTGITAPLITGWRGGIYAGGRGKRSRRSLKEF